MCALETEFEVALDKAAWHIFRNKTTTKQHNNNFQRFCMILCRGVRPKPVLGSPLIGVSQRRLSEKTFIFTAELMWAFIANGQTGGIGVHVFCDHEPLRLL